MSRRVLRVRVPASTSNLGAGFDVLGLALRLYNEVEVRRAPGRSGLILDVEGEGAGSLPRGEKNVVWQCLQKVLLKARKPVRGYSVRCVNRIPLARGLGSSAAARLGGLLAGNALAGSPFSRQQILDWATEMEGHPDNLVPSLVGGLCLSARVEGRVRYLRLDPPRGLAAVVCVPDFQLSTQKARAVLPSRVSLSDAVFNVSRVALFLGALQSREDSFLKLGVEDRLHQPYRKALVPGFDRVVAGAERAGALAVFLSGAGPAIFAFARKAQAGRIGRAMEAGFEKAGHGAAAMQLDFSAEGSEVEWR